MELLSALNFTLSIIIGLLLLVVLVVIHELGHAIAARRSGVVVEEFGIGFPPRAWSKKLKNGVLLTLNYLPLGGFVKLQGEHDAANKKGDYGAASLPTKMKILLAGVTINWLAAAIIFAVIAPFGIPKVLDNQFSVRSDTVELSGPVVAAAVGPDTPASKAGLKVGDTVLSLANNPVDSATVLPSLTKTLRGQTVELVYARDDQRQTTQVTLNKDNKAQGYLGITPSQRNSLRSTWSAPIVGVGLTAQFSYVTVVELGKLVGNLFSGLAAQLNPTETIRERGSQNIELAGRNVAGPIGILGVIFPAAREQGIVSLLFLTAIISLTLAVMNILPIPALDGGRAFVTLLFRALKKPLTKPLEERIHGTGFMVLIVLIIVITIADVGKFFG